MNIEEIIIIIYLEKKRYMYIEREILTCLGT